MSITHVKAMATAAPTATNEMLVQLTAGIFAGTEDMSADGAVKRAEAALEAILKITIGSD
jgi:hypothetical protein